MNILKDTISSFVAMVILVVTLIALILMLPLIVIAEMLGDDEDDR